MTESPIATTVAGLRYSFTQGGHAVAVVEGAVPESTVLLDDAAVMQAEILAPKHDAHA